jgi:uncharacterized OsmC-like protein
MAIQQEMLNGVDVEELKQKVEVVQKDPDRAQFQFRIRNRWLIAGRNQTTITDFDGDGQTNRHAQPFILDADEPPLLLGEDQGANPVEYLLTALVSCLTSSLVYHAAVRGIHIEEVESEVEGDLDIRGFMGVAPDVRKGYRNIRVTFRVKSDAPKEKLEELARFSPVLDVVSNGTNVSLVFE